METLLQRVYSGEFTAETYCGDFTAETSMLRLYHRDFTVETLLQRLYRIGSGGGVFSVLVCHWLPLATITLVGDNKELKLEAYFEFL